MTGKICIKTTNPKLENQAREVEIYMLLCVYDDNDITYTICTTILRHSEVVCQSLKHKV